MSGRLSMGEKTMLGTKKGKDAMTRRANSRLSLVVTASLALTTLMGSVAPATAAAVVEGAKVGTWKTWNIASPDEITVPQRADDASDQTKAELNELRLLQMI